MTTTRPPVYQIIATVSASYPHVVRYLTGRALWLAMAAKSGGELKTFDGYFRQLWNRARELYNGEITEAQFVDALAELVTDQITRAWRAALRDNGQDPELVNSTYAGDVEEIILREFDRVDQFAADIAEAASKEAGVDQFRARAELWANRYNDAYNMAVLRISEEIEKDPEEPTLNLIWKLGATERHCEICDILHNTIAKPSVWREAGIYPQAGVAGLPNPALVPHHDGQDGCGGWRCDCGLEQTDEAATVETAAELRDMIGWN